ncbi:urea transporter [Mycobacterium marinum]|uniref:Urea transporter n=1 Tax=Mycobacterium marinum TaxID=1781 RepID=A0A3E2MPR6_MYCMR|nr:urea transporter [Mycobacterium marinum]QQW33543.1 urea transporter [Mycobacterium marinum]RFZ34014.1 Urea transporter [Mycobacterium marinum]
MQRPVETSEDVPYYRLVLRGCSQLCFQSNALTGLFFLAAVLVASPIAAAYFLVAAIMAPAGRMLLGERGPVLATGLPGLNPCLIALSLPVFFRTSWTDVGMWGVLVVCVVITVVLVRLLVAALPFPILAFPFLIVFWGLYALAPHLDVLRPAASGPPAGAAFHPISAVLLSLGQALFSPSIWSGLLFLAGILLSSWRHAVLAFLGATIGTAVSYYYGDVHSMNVNSGLYGFNGVLTAVAVYALCGGKLRLAILGALVATILTPAIAAVGLQTVSAPFVFTTWLVLALGWIEQQWFDVPAPAIAGVPMVKSGGSSDIEHNPQGDAHMSSPPNSIVFSNLLERVKNLRAIDDWTAFRPGVTAHWLYTEGNGGPAAVLLRYEPGARVAEHEHVGYEHLFILEGDQFDEHGSYPQGSFVINPPGTRHSPGSVGGCVALLIYEKAVRFLCDE